MNDSCRPAACTAKKKKLSCRPAACIEKKRKFLTAVQIALRFARMFLVAVQAYVFYQPPSLTGGVASPVITEQCSPPCRGVACNAPTPTNVFVPLFGREAVPRPVYLGRLCLLTKKQAQPAWIEPTRSCPNE
ncbi:MAG: hypothetical protein LBD59_02695 [Prevotellaceae bacterium]|nr:hypothetical protein [Prevotellaceae bacterium]